MLNAKRFGASVTRRGFLSRSLAAGAALGGAAMCRGRALPAVITTLRGIAAPRQDALGNPCAYSLAIGENQLPLGGYFPVGMAGGYGGDGGYALGFHRLTPMGFNNCQAAIVPYAWKNGQAVPAEQALSNRGLWLMCCWTAYTLATSLQTPHYPGAAGLPAAVGPDGKTPTNNSPPYHNDSPFNASLFSHRVRRYLADGDAACVEANLKGWDGQSDRISCWGIDNEWNVPLDYSPLAKAAFRRWLAHTYRDIKRLNAAWDRRYSGFGQVQPPWPGSAGTTVNHYSSFDLTSPLHVPYAAWLDWHAFQEQNYAAVIVERFRAIRGADHGKRPVISKTSDWTMEATTIAKGATVDWGLLGEEIRPVCGGLIGLDSYGGGDTACYRANYAFNCLRPLDRGGDYGVFLTETNAGGGVHAGGRFAETYWRLPANGLKAVNYFCLGGVGAAGDWDVYGFMSPVGELRGDMYYAGRWANMIHRTERLWTNARPASVAGAPAVAILLPHRDVMIAPNPPAGMWAPCINNRVDLFTWLRQQGYWVDVIPYQKLAPDFLAGYAALLLAGADHLTPSECAAIGAYVKSGGCVLADTAAGYFDEHHVACQGLDEVLGIRRPHVDLQEVLASRDKVTYDTSAGPIIGQGRVGARLTTAIRLYPEAAAAAADANSAWATLNHFGRGAALWLNTQVGTLSAPRAELVGGFLAGLLRRAGVEPAYRVAPADQGPLAHQLRVEQPYTDASGNCVVAVANYSANHIAPFQLELPLPAGPWSGAWWAPAETASLEKLPIRALGQGRYSLQFPGIQTAGVIYLLKTHAPLLGAMVISSAKARDGFTAMISPGKPFQTTVQLVNPAARPAGAGTLRLLTPRGWKVDGTPIATPPLGAHQQAKFTFTVTPPAEQLALQPEWLYPLVARWNDGVSDKAVCTVHVEMKLAPARVPRLLSDNPRPRGYPYVIKTGATSRRSATPGGMEASYDLKGVYEINQVKIVFNQVEQPQVHGSPLTGLTVLTSRDGKHFREVINDAIVRKKDMEGQWDKWLWFNSKLFRAQGRYVRINMRLRDGNVDISEIAIWGRAPLHGKQTESGR